MDEMDVVTEEKRCFSTNEAVTTFTIPVCPKSATFTSVRMQQNELILKRCAPIHQQQNYAPPYPHMATEDTPLQKKLENKVPCSVQPVMQPKSNNSCPQNSDSQDRKYRWHHTIQECQRCKAMRSGFLMLRDCIPELAKNEKASRFLILQKATENIHSLQVEQRELLLKMEECKPGTSSC